MIVPFLGTIGSLNSLATCSTGPVNSSEISWGRTAFEIVEYNENADINNDGIINVLDVIGVVNIILGINN